MSESRSCVSILESAHAELIARRDRLRPFVDELKDCDAAIKVIEKALPKAAPALPATTDNKRRGGRPAKKDLLLDRLAQGPILRDEISTFLDRSEYLLKPMLNEMVRDGQIALAEDERGQDIVRLT